jgi:hypothetical protein
MKWAVTSVSISVKTRRRMGKAAVSVVDVENLRRFGVKEPLSTALDVEKYFEKTRSGRESVAKVVDVRLLDERN